MSELKTVDEIEVGYSKSQIYWRVKKLVESGLMEPPERGERNQYLFGPRHVRILQKLAESEEEYDTVQEAISEINFEEVGEATDEEIGKSIDSLKDRIRALEKRIAEVEEKTDSLENRLSVQNDRLQKFRERWRDQLKGGVDKLKDLFG